MDRTPPPEPAPDPPADRFGAFLASQLPPSVPAWPPAQWPAEAFEKLFARHFQTDLRKLIARYRQTPDGDHRAALLAFADRLGDASCALLILSVIAGHQAEHQTDIGFMIHDLDRYLTTGTPSQSKLMRLLALYTHNPHGNHASALMSFADRFVGGPKSALVSLSLVAHVMPGHEAAIRTIAGDLLSFLSPRR